MSLHILVDPPEADVDIVAVHGLNPFGKDDHALGTWSNGDHMWLRDSFPSKEPKARVMMYEYNANVAFHSSIAGVNECADKLLGVLAMERKDNPKRPLLFICHSLGGIIVKAAIVEASLNAKYQKIREATYGLVFFATPHDGSDYAELGGVAATIARAILRNPENSFLNSLEKDSLFSDSLKKHFRHRLEDFKIVSFFETLPMMKMKHPVVGMKSAVLGLASQREDAFSIDTNHVDICKFSGPDDSNYKFVAEQISNLCIEAKNYAMEKNADDTMLDNLSNLRVPQGHPAVREDGIQLAARVQRQLKIEQEQSDEQLKRDCLVALATDFHEMGDRHRNIPATTDNSGTWLFDTAEYTTWHSSTSCKEFLSIRGSMGWGKSVLMKKAVSRSELAVRKRGDCLILSFFFDGCHNSFQPNRNGSVAMYRTLLYQALDGLESLPRELLESIKPTGSKLSQKWDLNNLQRLLTKALKACPKSIKCIYVYLDALDEWDTEDRRAAGGLSFFENLDLDGTLLKVCSSRRLAPPISVGLGPETNEIVIERAELNKSDITQYIRRTIEGNRDSELTPEKKHFTLSELSKKAGSNFLWASLVAPKIADLIHSKNEDQIRDLIDKIPEKLSLLYERLLLDLPTTYYDHGVICFIFKLASFAREPLSLEEVMDVVLLRIYPNTWKDERTKFQDATNSERLRAMSNGLIDVFRSNAAEGSASREIVQFAHASIRTYMVEEKGLQILDPACSQATCDLEILKICLEYFKHDRMIPGRVSPLQLRRYVTSFWLDHARGCDQLILTQSDMPRPPFLGLGKRFTKLSKAAMDLYHQNLFRRASLRIIRAGPSLARERRLLVYLAFEGCTALLVMYRDCISAMLADDEDDYALVCALYQAVEHNRVATARCLKEQFGCNINAIHRNSTPLFHACYLGHEEMVSCLLSMGADVHEESNQRYVTPLIAAVGNQNQKIVEILAEENSEYVRLLQHTDDEGQTALHIAAHHGLHEMVNALLPDWMKDGDLQETLALTDSKGQNALDVAIENGQQSVIDTLELYL